MNFVWFVSLVRPTILTSNKLQTALSNSIVLEILLVVCAVQYGLYLLGWYIHVYRLQ